MKDIKLSTPLPVVVMLGLLTLVSAAIGYAQVGGGFDLSWNTVDGGGGRSSAGGYELTGDIGQPDSTILTYSNVYTLYGGFYWAGPEPTPCPACPSPTPTLSPTACTVQFTDVQPTDYFYDAVRYLYCHGAVSGYSDGTFRPYNNTTRGQLSKIVTNGDGWTIDISNGPHFSDVPTTDPFYDYIETAYHRNIISGYNCGTNCLEFRPGNNATRGQISKIVYGAITSSSGLRPTTGL